MKRLDDKQKIEKFLKDNGVTDLSTPLELLLEEEAEGIAKYMAFLQQKEVSTSEIVFELRHDLEGLMNDGKGFYPRYERWLDQQIREAV